MAANTARTLLRDSPLFGPEPEALSLMRVEVRAEHVASSMVPLSNAVEAASSGVRTWIGVGESFAERGTASRPRELVTLFFNGDLECNVRQDAADALVIVGGGWNEVIESTRRVSITVSPLGRITDIDVGYRLASGRGHGGFLDGTSNLQELSADAFAQCVFVQNEDDADHAGGTYLVVRKYIEDVDLWEDLPQAVQEQFIGRLKDSGCFLDGGESWQRATWRVTHPHAHIRKAHARNSDSWTDRIYRRSVPFLARDGDGIVSGLLFVALCRSPARQIVRIHNERLLPSSEDQDLLLSSAYVRPVSSGLYYLPPTLD